MAYTGRSMADSMRCSTFSSPFLFPFSLFPVFLAFALVLAGCANPVPPGGGPRDTTPPSIVESTPSEAAVNVDLDASVDIAFSEYIERGSFEQALTITPRPDGELEIDFDGRSVSIEFPEALRDNTTYILTLDTNLQDTRGVSLEEPITLAFSTGPTIDRGQISGRVVQADDGAPQEGIDVYAYILDDSTDAGSTAPIDSLPSRPAYRTQTGSDGAFRFDYLKEQPYFVIALTDNNRNRQPDPAEAFAPPPQQAVVADSTGATIPRPWVAARPDTLPPRFVRIQSRSRRRHALRFDAPVQLLNRTPDRWQLQDSVRDASVPIGAVYQRAGSRSLVVLRTPPLNPTPHRLILPAETVADSSENTVDTDTLRFTPVDEPDTLQTRFVRFVPQGLAPDSAGVYTLLPDERPGVRLNEPIDSTRLRTVITAQDSLGAARNFTLSTADGTTYRLHFTPAPRSTERVDVQVGGPPLARTDTTFTRMFRRISNRQLGSLSGTVALSNLPRPDTTASNTPASNPPADTLSARAPANTADTLASPPLIVELYATTATAAARATPRSATADSTGRFVFPQLPEGTFRFRAFLDVNGNGTWDSGWLVPYQAPEPITWSEGTIDSRPRWENVLESPLRIPRPPSD
jgi:hypothetical protein